MKASAKLKQLEEENEDAMFVVVSDVWLDSVEVMDKLTLMFSGQHSSSASYADESWQEHGEIVWFGAKNRV